MTDKDIFKQEAKIIVDMMFDNKLFRDGITRDDMSAFEKLIAFNLHTRYKTHVKLGKFMDFIQTTKHDLSSNHHPESQDNAE